MVSKIYKKKKKITRLTSGGKNYNIDLFFCWAVGTKKKLSQEKTNKFLLRY